MDVAIRAELPADRQGVFAVNAAAFPTDSEAQLVEGLHMAGLPLLSLVAVVETEVVGHILFSPVIVVNGDVKTPAIALGPVAVHPAHQRLGIGSQLIREGLRQCTDLGHQIGFVLGHPDYYSRFGFRLAAPHGLHYKDASFDPYFMFLELLPGSARGVRGEVAYHELFDGG
ncbi:MAG TPA: N-acetyltransferase [Anaerolineales bacterium]|nr:N-acetyltransferase [Anaerolineales bacterium]